MQSGPTPPSEEVDDDAGLFSEINITPLTDVFLVLLIIFMVVSSSMVEAEKQAAQAKNLVSERALSVLTPEGTGESPLIPKDIVISVTPDGTIYLEGDTFPIGELAERLRKVEKGAAATRVVVRGDQEAQYKLVWQVIRAAQAAGFPDVALASRAKD
ncbi:MAG: biopolymer transporter ExbD [Deltaproteobacteria bacterium]|nr:biopolymer transporter ExbD [Deltaproteobacteria bacterium]